MLAKKFSPKTQRIALYIRVSTEEQASNPEGSIKSQEQRLRQYIDFKSSEGAFGNVAGVYIDRARSGKDTNRPELQRLLAAIRKGEITMVMVTELSRLSRSIKDFCEIWNLMKAQSCELLSLREQFDTTSAAGEMVLYTIANIAQFERRQVSERVSANLVARAERGLYNGGSMPYGYRSDPEKRGHLVIHEEEAKLVREIFATFIKEGSLVNCGKSLHERGYRYSRVREPGGPKARLAVFTVGNLHHILTNEAYAGVRVFKAKGEVKRTTACWAAIIDKETFESAQKILKKNYRKNKTRMNQRYPFLLSGLCKCGQCGDQMVGKSAHGNGGKYPYYEHGWSTRKQACLNEKFFSCKPHRVSAKKVEKTIWGEIELILSSPEVAATIIKDAQTIYRSRSNISEFEKLQGKVRAIADQIEALAEHLAKIPKDVSPQPIYAQMKRLEGFRRSAEMDLETAKASDFYAEMPASIRDYDSLIEFLKNKLSNGDSPEVRTKIAQKLIHKVEILPNDEYNVYLYAGDRHVPPKEKAPGDSQGSLFYLNGSKTVDSGGGGGS